MRSIALPAALVLSLAACTTPPITTPPAKSTVKLRDLWPNAPQATATVPVPPLPVFRVNYPEGVAIEVPANARSVNLTSAALNMAITNRMKFPLTLQLFLARSNPYDTQGAALTPEPITIAANETKRVNQQVDPTLFKQERIFLGLSFSSPGTGLEAVEVNPEDAVDVETTATVQVRLF